MSVSKNGAKRSRLLKLQEPVNLSGKLNFAEQQFLILLIFCRSLENFIDTTS